MTRISKDLQQRSKAYRAEQYRKLFTDKPDVKTYVTVRKVLLWTLRCLYILNFLCALLVMGSIGDFSQILAEAMRLVLGLFFFWIAGRTYQGALCLWLLVFGNLSQGIEYIKLFDLVTDPAYWAASPAAVIMYFIQILYVLILLPTAIYLTLPASRRRQEETKKVEKAYIDMIAAEMPGIR